MTRVSTTSADQRLRDLARLRRARDRMDREHAQPLDVEALAREAQARGETALIYASASPDEKRTKLT